MNEHALPHQTAAEQARPADAVEPALPGHWRRPPSRRAQRDERRGKRRSRSGGSFLFLRPVADIGLQHLVLEVLAVHHGLGHVVEADHAHEHLLVHHRHVARVAVEHHAAHLVHLGLERAGEGRVVHRRAHEHGAHGAAVLHDGLDDLAEGEHADQVAVVHHHQRADVLVRHDLHGFRQGLVGGDGEERVAFDAEDVADFHGRSPGGAPRRGGGPIGVACAI